MSETTTNIGAIYFVFSCQLITKNRQHFKQSTGAPSKSRVGGPQRSHAFSARKRLVSGNNVATNKKSAGFLWCFFAYKPSLKVWWLKTYIDFFAQIQHLECVQCNKQIPYRWNFLRFYVFLHRWMCNSIRRIAQLIFLGDHFLGLTGQLLDSRAP